MFQNDELQTEPRSPQDRFLQAFGQEPDSAESDPRDVGREGCTRSALLSLLLAAVGVFAASCPASAQQAAGTEDASIEAANPYLAFLPPDVEPDWEQWQRRLSQEAAERARRRQARAPGLVFGESEAVDERGLNDHALIADFVPGFGTAPGEQSTALLQGALYPPPAPLTSAEPDGAIPLATALSVIAGRRYRVAATIGDGLYGSAGSGRGDLDVYSFSAPALARLEVVVRSRGSGSLDPAFVLYDSTGTAIAFGEDTIRGGFFTSTNAELSFDLPRDDTYYLLVGGQHPDFGAPVPQDPFDPASGPGVTSEGDYEVVFGLDLSLYSDVDVFAVDLRAGDVVGAVLSQCAARLTLRHPSGDTLVSSRLDLSANYPPTSPLPGGGDAVLAYVIDADGRYTFELSAPQPFVAGDYDLEVELHRTPVEPTNPGPQQILYLDFDGALVDRARFSAAPSELVALSSLRCFLSRWSLSGSAENALIDEILDTVTDKLDADVRQRGHNGDFASSGRAGEFAVSVQNSRDHADPGDGPAVSRLVIGGTIDEFRFNTVGLASHIDPGNFERAGVAVVLLDLLSEEPEHPISLNGVERSAGVDPVTLIGRAIGSIAAHEAGHLVGNFHTERDRGPSTIMDSGGRIDLVLGSGADRIFGTADDVEVDLAADRYEPFEGFSGTENTLQVVSFGLPAAGVFGRLVVSPLQLDFSVQAPGSSTTLPLTLANAGNGSVTLLSTTATPSPPYSVGAPPTTLLAGESATLDVGYSSALFGQTDGSLTLDTAAPSATSLTVPLVATTGQPTLDLPVTTYDFGALEYGDASTAATVTLEARNVGNAPLVIEADLAGGTPERFALELGRSPLAPGETLPLRLRFEPGGPVGAARTSLLLRTNDPLRQRVQVELLGRSEGPELEISPRSPFVYGAWRVGDPTRRTFRLQNRGTRPLGLDSVRLSTDTDRQYRITRRPAATVGAAEEDGVTVEFLANRRGLAVGHLIIDSNDPDEASLTVDLFAFGGYPEAAVTPTSLDFGYVPPGDERTLTLELLNPDPVFTLRADLVLMGDPSFVLEGASTLTLPAEESTVIELSFLSASDGAVEAELVLDTNDPFMPTTRIPLRGSGVPTIPVLDQRGLVLLGLLLVLAGVGLRRVRSSV